MVTTNKYVHNMNTFYNRWKKDLTAINVFIAHMMNPADASYDNEKSIAVDGTESDKSEDKADQADQTPVEAIPESSAFMNEAENAQFEQIDESAKHEEPEQAKETPEP